MKFILGYRPGTKAKLHPGPELIWTLVVRHGAKKYHFERILKDDKGLCTTKLCVYDSKDYPDKMVSDLLTLKQIVEWHGDKIMQSGGR